MGLPFLSAPKKQQTGLITKLREPDQKELVESIDYAEECAKDLIEAIHAKDVKRVTQVLKDTFELMKHEPESPANEEE